SESLVLSLQNEEALQNFLNLAQEVGFKKVKWLLIIRDPVDHALSLYKHRAKNGAIEEIEQWVKQAYSYGSVLNNFLKGAEAHSIELTCRKYQKSGEVLEKLFFKDWLGLDLNLDHPFQSVNPSLAISELLFLKKLRVTNKALVKPTYRQFLQTPVDQKAKEPRIQNYYRQVLNDQLLYYMDAWELCNQWLPKEEKLQLPIPKSEDKHIDLTEKVFTFSEKQTEAITEMLNESLKTAFRWRLTYSAIKKQLGQVRNRLISKS
ncbi:MAG: hypothetical protein BRD49_03225, partial [Bacteroidetes bacterium SW_10_40_5]